MFCFIVFPEGEGRFLLFCSFVNLSSDLLYVRLDRQLADSGPLLDGSIDLNATADQNAPDSNFESLSSSCGEVRSGQFRAPSLKSKSPGSRGQPPVAELFTLRDFPSPSRRTPALLAQSHPLFLLHRCIRAERPIWREPRRTPQFSQIILPKRKGAPQSSRRRSPSN